MFILDQFQHPHATSSIGTEWTAFTDGVMGGQSSMRAWRETQDARPCLCMEGDVRLENNGGFIQVALPLVTRGYPFSAAHYQGITIVTRGAGVPFSVHLRTTANRAPWEHFEADLPVTDAWQRANIPFEDFSGRLTRARLDVHYLTRLGIVAKGRRGFARLAIAEVGFY